MKDKISLLCTYNPENDQLSIDLAKGMNHLSNDDKNVVTDAVGYVIGGFDIKALGKSADSFKDVRKIIANDNFKILFKKSIRKF